MTGAATDALTNPFRGPGSSDVKPEIAEAMMTAWGL